MSITQSVRPRILLLILDVLRFMNVLESFCRSFFIFLFAFCAATPVLGGSTKTRPEGGGGGDAGDTAKWTKSEVCSEYHFESGDSQNQGQEQEFDMKYHSLHEFRTSTPFKEKCCDHF